MSLESNVDENVEDLWVEEAVRRLAELEQGLVTPIDAVTVMKEARQALK